MSKSNPKKMKQVANKAGIYLLFIVCLLPVFFLLSEAFQKNG